MTITKEDTLIEEAKQLLYSRLRVLGDAFTSSKITTDYLSLQLADKQREVFCCLFLSTKNTLIEYREMFVGTIDSCGVYPREVAKAALLTDAAAVILAHNHPSGNPEPSQADRAITDKIVHALEHLDIRVLDHIIVANTETTSFAERGYI